VDGGHVDVSVADDGEKLKLDCRALELRPALLPHS
jgi:hypothetical protein